jgi:hypothetical protein
MGLGKTLSILALILATREEKATPGYSGATLISTLTFHSCPPITYLENKSLRFLFYPTGRRSWKNMSRRTLELRPMFTMETAKTSPPLS